MHPDLKEKIYSIFGEKTIEYQKLKILIDSVNEILLNLEYEVCINKKLSAHFINEYRQTQDLLTQSNLRCLELQVLNAQLQSNKS